MQDKYKYRKYLVIVGFDDVEVAVVAIVAE